MHGYVSFIVLLSLLLDESLSCTTLLMYVIFWPWSFAALFDRQWKPASKTLRLRGTLGAKMYGSILLILAIPDVRCGSTVPIFRRAILEEQADTGEHGTKGASSSQLAEGSL